MEDATEAWAKKTGGGVDWSKCLTINGARVCLGVEIQMSARSDLLIMDVAHLREAITTGACDVGVIVVPSDQLGVYLTDRGPDLSSARRAIQNGRAEDLPLVLVAIDHDGPGEPLAKLRTRQGKLGQPPSN